MNFTCGLNKDGYCRIKIRKNKYHNMDMEKILPYLKNDTDFELEKESKRMWVLKSKHLLPVSVSVITVGKLFNAFHRQCIEGTRDEFKFIDGRIKKFVEGKQDLFRD